MQSLVLVLLFIFLQNPVQASYSSVFGLGPENLAMGGTSLDYGNNSAYSAYNNPAALAFFQRSQMSLGYLSTMVDIRAFGSVVVDENGGVGTFENSGVLGGQGQTLGLAIPLGNKLHPLTFGAVAYFSGDSVSRVSGPPINNPYYPIYQDVVRNATYTVGAGYRVWNGLALGLAGNTSLISLADYRVVNKTGGSFSASAVEVKSVFSPSFSVMYDFAYLKDEGQGLPLLVSIMRKGKSELKTKLHADIQVQGIPVSGDLTSYPHFSPAEWVLAASYRIERATTLAFDLARVEWSAYKNPFGSGNINSFVFGGNNESAGFHDVWVPRVGAQHKFFMDSGFIREYLVRLGYFYYPTPVPDQSGDSNYADSNRHGISFGAGAATKNPWIEAADSLIRLDLFAQYNLLTKRTVTKATANKLGAPGYTVGGNIWIIGLATSLDF